MLMKRIGLEIPWLHRRIEIRDVGRLRYLAHEVYLAFNLSRGPRSRYIVPSGYCGMLVVLNPYLRGDLSLILINSLELVHILR